MNPVSGAQRTGSMDMTQGGSLPKLCEYKQNIRKLLPRSD
jgi:hypothetical protein